MWLLFKIDLQQHFAHREIWNGVYGFLECTQPHCRAKSRRAMVELTENWQVVFDQAVRIKKRARHYLEERGKEDGHAVGVGQPPPNALVPPSIPTMEESGKLPQEDRSNKEVRSSTSLERTKEDSREAAVEAVRRMTASNSLLESSTKSGHGERSGGIGTPPTMGLP